MKLPFMPERIPLDRFYATFINLRSLVFTPNAFGSYINTAVQPAEPSSTRYKIDQLGLFSLDGGSVIRFLDRFDQIGTLGISFPDFPGAYLVPRTGHLHVTTLRVDAYQLAFLPSLERLLSAGYLKTLEIPAECSFGTSGPNALHSLPTFLNAACANLEVLDLELPFECTWVSPCTF